MSTMFTIPPNHIVCKSCGGSGSVDVSSREPSNFVMDCLHCDGNGHILNPLIDEWRTCQRPAWMIEMLGANADNKRLDMWCGQLRGEWKAKAKFLGMSIGEESIVDQYGATDWLGYFSRDAYGSNYVRPEWACNLIRCIWPNPFIERERVIVEPRHDLRVLTESPIIDPRWRTGTVMDLARAIRNYGKCNCSEGEIDFSKKPLLCGNCNSVIEQKPRHERMPVLGDALQDAGCDDEEVIQHCQSAGPHVAGCWVIEAILG